VDREPPRLTPRRETAERIEEQPKMTLVLNEIHGMGPTRQPLMIAAADRRISNQDGSYNSSRRKVFRVPRIAGAVSYFGLAEFPQGGRQTFLSDWLQSFVRRSQAAAIADLAQDLWQALNAVVPGRLLLTQPSGLHLCGFDADGRPDFWFISNIGGMQGFEYTDLQDTYLQPASHFLGRDAGGFGLDLATGRAPVGRLQIYRNGDFRVHAIVSEALDRAFSTFREFPDFGVPNTPAEYGAYVRFKFEVIAYIYKKWARRQIVARPIDVIVLEAV
jgi:hypothetical protein